MYYPENDEEFSDWIFKHIKEIKGMNNISEEYRTDLYKEVDKTIQAYEEQKKFHTKEKFKHLMEVLGEIYNNLEKLGIPAQKIKKNLPTLERIARDLQEIKKSKENNLKNSIN